MRRARRILRALWLRVRPFVDRHGQRAEIDEEIAFHLEMEEAHRRTRGEPDAGRNAVRAFGGVERHREELRRTGGITAVESTLADLRFGLRKLRSSPLSSTLLVLTMGVGLGSMAAIFGVAASLTWSPLPYPRADRLVVLDVVSPEGTAVPLSLAELTAWSEADGGLEATAGYDPTFADLRLEGRRTRVPGAEATAGLAGTLGVSPLAGSWVTAEQDRPGAPPVVVLSHGLATDLFGSPSRALDREVELSGTAYRITGVMPPGFAFPDAARFWVPLGRVEAYQDPENRDLLGVARLRNGAPTTHEPRVTADLADRLTSAVPVRDPRLTPRMRPLRATYLDATEVTTAWTLMAAVTILTLLASVNTAHLVFLRTLGRRHELATRARLGASRGRVRRQLVSEGLLVAALTLSVAVPAALAVRARLLADVAGGLPPGLDLSLPGAAGLVLVALVGAALALGLVLPVSVALRRMGGTARREARGRIGSNRSGPVIVAGQVALAFALVGASAVAQRSLLEVASVDPGFRTEDAAAVLVSFPGEVFGTDDSRRDAVRFLVDGAAARPGVTAAGATLRVPVTGRPIEVAVAPEGPLPETPPVVHFSAATPGFLDAMGIPLLEGRDLTWEDGLADPVVLVSEDLARTLWPGVSAVGRRLRVGDDRSGVPGDTPASVVIGVTGSVRPGGRTSGAAPTVWIPFNRFPAYYATVVVAGAGSSATLLAGAEATVAETSTELIVLGTHTVEDLLRGTWARARLAVGVLSVFGVLALLLASLGTFAVAHDEVRRRTREFGIRLALGADPLRMVTRSLGSTGLGLAIGMALGLAILTLARDAGRAVLPDLPLAPAGALVVAAGALVVATLAAALGPARAAARTPPADTLRAER